MFKLRFNSSVAADPKQTEQSLQRKSAKEQKNSSKSHTKAMKKSYWI